MSVVRTSRETARERKGHQRDHGSVEAVEDLSSQARGVILDNLVRIIEGVYVHLPLKRAMYGIDAAQQLRRLMERSNWMADAEFHAEVARIVRGLRDAHTTYVAPVEAPGRVARLPFLVEQYGPEDDPSFLVSKVISDIVDDSQFVEGVELEYWNGTPIADAVRRHSHDERGGRPDSAMARAVDSLTFRPLGYVPIPIEHWVVVGYRTSAGVARDVKLEWRFINPGDGPDVVRPTEAAAIASAIHPDRAVIRRAKKLSFNPDLWRTEGADRHRATLPAVPTEGWMSGQFQDNVSAKVVTAHGRQYGYLRLWSFDLVDDDGFLDEVISLLALLPRDGLIIDLRGNPGGLIWAAERLLQLFTPNRIDPTRFSLIASDITRTMSDAPQNRRWLSPWRRSLGDAVGTGEIYSRSVPITPLERCNDIGQIYGGPVVAVVDATTYSAGDLFAAGFADNHVGSIVSVGRATGAGGANVWRDETLRSVLSGTDAELDPFPPGVGFTISIRRATRIGASEGAPIEDVGVAGHRIYAMDREDLLNSNQNLIDYCGQLLDAEPATAMKAIWTGDVVSVTASGLSRVDVYADDRPLGTYDIDGPLTITPPADAETVRVEGYKGATLVQVRQLVETPVT